MNTRLPLIALVAATFTQPSFTEAADLQFQLHGKPVKQASLDALQSGIKPAPEKIKVRQPHEEKEIEFTGFPVAPLLDTMYGPAWHQADEAIFICADGYRSPVPIERIVKHKAWLTFARTDRDGKFTITENQPKPHEVELSPLALVWDNLNDEDSKRMGAEGWPWQIVGIDLVTFAEKYPKLALPPKASASAQRGQKLYRSYCISCHAVGGQGGSVGPELGEPVSVTTYFKEEWLKKWIANPQAIRAGSKMPAVLPAGPERASQAADLVAYLKSLASRVSKAN
jgi:cytochrome c2